MVINIAESLRFNGFGGLWELIQSLEADIEKRVIFEKRLHNLHNDNPLKILLNC